MPSQDGFLYCWKAMMQLNESLNSTLRRLWSLVPVWRDDWCFNGPKIFYDSTSWFFFMCCSWCSKQSQDALLVSFLICCFDVCFAQDAAKFYDDFSPLMDAAEIFLNMTSDFIVLWIRRYGKKTRKPVIVTHTAEVERVDWVQRRLH